MQPIATSDDARYSHESGSFRGSTCPPRRYKRSAHHQPRLAQLSRQTPSRPSSNWVNPPMPPVPCQRTLTRDFCHFTSRRVLRIMRSWFEAESTGRVVVTVSKQKQNKLGDLIDNGRHECSCNWGHIGYWSGNSNIVRAAWRNSICRWALARQNRSLPGELP